MKKKSQKIAAKNREINNLRGKRQTCIKKDW